MTNDFFPLVFLCLSYYQGQTFFLSFQEAVSRLLDIVPTNATPETERESDEKKEFYLPPSAVTKKRVFSYLIKTRGIDRNILTTFIHAGLIYEDNGGLYLPQGSCR